MGGLPTYHPEWLITLWFSTPGLNHLDPHVTLAILGIILIVVFYFNRKRVVVPVIDKEEEVFKQLVTKKKVIEKQIAELELSLEQQTITNEQYQEKFSEFGKLLEQTRQKLRQFT